MLVAFSTITPLIGGYLADYFTKRHLNLTAEWSSPHVTKAFRLLELHGWNFLFLIGAFLAFIALQLLLRVKELGEVEKDVVVRILRSNIKNRLKESFVIGNLINLGEQVLSIIKREHVK